MITDFHTHAFPDDLAPRAMAALSAGADDAESFHGGTVADLLEASDGAGVERVVVANIATKPAQWEKILAWSAVIRSERVVPFGSVHPADPDWAAHAAAMAAAGLRGIKVHPYYQEFLMDGPWMMDLARACRDLDLVLLTHAGDDIAYPSSDVAAPARAARLLEAVPGVKLVAAHMGAWKRWEEVRDHLAGRPVWLETSFALGLIDPEVWDAIVARHSPDRILFGTDSPWTDQLRARRQIEARHGENTFLRWASANADALLA